MLAAIRVTSTTPQGRAARPLSTCRPRSATAPRLVRGPGLIKVAVTLGMPPVWTIMQFVIVSTTGPSAALVFVLHWLYDSCDHQLPRR